MRVEQRSRSAVATDPAVPSVRLPACNVLGLSNENGKATLVALLHLRAYATRPVLNELCHPPYAHPSEAGLTSACRGPAKGYIEGLEHRLHEAESLLLALLPVITTEQLDCATDSLGFTPSPANTHGVKARDSQSPRPQNVRRTPPNLNKKTGIEYWDSFPLDTVENIRKWQEDCTLQSTAQSQSLSRNSISGDDPIPRDVMKNAFNSAQNSRPSSVDNSTQQHARSQSGAFRSMSTDSYGSGTSTPVHISQHSHSQPAIPTGTHFPQQATSQLQQDWRSMSLFSSLDSPDGMSSNPTGSNVTGVGIDNEALLLQSFADTTWAQSQSLNHGLGHLSSGSGPGNSMSMESGPMEVDTGFLTNDMQRRLFW
ncbi:hypothetical protein LTR41_002824 [Exophiala xenobiotica]|nr:hypothetical protein LTR41_002824 [Exophiala xenobiotica]